MHLCTVVSVLLTRFLSLLSKDQGQCKKGIKMLTLASLSGSLSTVAWHMFRL
jgi:hypothetical protein